MMPSMLNVLLDILVVHAAAAQFPALLEYLSQSQTLTRALHSADFITSLVSQSIIELRHNVDTFDRNGNC